MKRLWNSIAFTMIFFFLLPLEAVAAEFLIPVGKVVGLQLSDDTVTVAAFDDSLGEQVKKTGLRIGDQIVNIDGQTVTCPEDVRSALSKCGDTVSLTVRRDGKTHSLQITPLAEEGSTRLGVYLRQGIAGVGTVTWYDPESGKFGTLGHGVSDPKGNVLHMTKGEAYDAEVVSVKKGKAGEPGQLKGRADPSKACGTLLRNTPQGVFGITKEGWAGEALPVASWQEVHTGSAVIRSNVQGNQVQEYSVEILKIYPEDRNDNRNLLLKVTDPALLSTTGGIVQGMSGSPIIQGGKIVGAVTHVLVNDPTMGYGIFIKNMLEAAA